jgi:hypothetical protein
MQRRAALDLLQSISKPLLVDGGYCQFGHMLYVLTGEGLITVDCRVYDPLLGPIGFSPQQYAEIREIAKESESLEENGNLDPDEKLFLFNDGQSDKPYFAFQPHDDAALDEYVFSEIVPKNRTASLVGRKPVNCCHYEKEQTKIQCRIQDQSGA